MDWAKLEQLLWYIPESDEDGVWDDGDPLILSGLPGRARLQRQARAYSDMEFGWNYARKLNQYGLDFPPILDPQDGPVYRAYHFMRTGLSDPVIDAAMLIRSYPRIQVARAKIEGLLVKIPADGDHRGHILQTARDTSLSVQVVNAYEKLFFNIRDRMHDSKYIEQVVYPNSRLEELVEGYGQNTDFRVLMIRNSYNNGPAALKHLAGGLERYSEARNAQELADRLESALMNQALLLASLGYGNQRSVPGLNHGRQLIQAAKMGGQEAALDPMLVGLGESIRKDMGGIQSVRQKAMLSANYE